MGFDLSYLGARLFGSPISLIPGLFYVGNICMIFFLLRTSSSHEVCALSKFATSVTIRLRVLSTCFWPIPMLLFYGKLWVTCFGFSFLVEMDSFYLCLRLVLLFHVALR